MLCLPSELFWRGDFTRPGRIVGWAVFGYALLRLLADGFLADAATISGIRITQLIALAVALGAVLLLSGSAFEETEGQAD